MRYHPIELPLEDCEGLLLFNGNRLAAIVSHLSNLHGDMAGRWCLEVILSASEVRIDGSVFDSLDDVSAYVEKHCAR